MTETIVDDATIFCSSNKIQNEICFEDLSSLKKDSRLLKIKRKNKKYPELSVVYSMFFKIQNKQKETEIINSYAKLLKNIQRSQE